MYDGMGEASCRTRLEKPVLGAKVMLPPTVTKEKFAKRVVRSGHVHVAKAGGAGASSMQPWLCYVHGGGGHVDGFVVNSFLRRVYEAKDDQGAKKSGRGRSSQSRKGGTSASLLPAGPVGQGVQTDGKVTRQPLEQGSHKGEDVGTGDGSSHITVLTARQRSSMMRFLVQRAGPFCPLFPMPFSRAQLLRCARPWFEHICGRLQVVFAAEEATSAALDFASKADACMCRRPADGYDSFPMPLLFDCRDCRSSHLQQHGHVAYWLHNCARVEDNAGLRAAIDAASTLNLPLVVLTPWLQGDAKASCPSTSCTPPIPITPVDADPVSRVICRLCEKAGVSWSRWTGDDIWDTFPEISALKLAVSRVLPAGRRGLRSRNASVEASCQHRAMYWEGVEQVRDWLNSGFLSVKSGNKVTSEPVDEAENGKEGRAPSANAQRSRVHVPVLPVRFRLDDVPVLDKRLRSCGGRSSEPAMRDQPMDSDDELFGLLGDEDDETVGAAHGAWRPCADHLAPLSSLLGSSSDQDDGVRVVPSRFVRALVRCIVSWCCGKGTKLLVCDHPASLQDYAIQDELVWQFETAHGLCCPSCGGFADRPLEAIDGGTRPAVVVASSSCVLPYVPWDLWACDGEKKVASQYEDADDQAHGLLQGSLRLREHVAACMWGKQRGSAASPGWRGMKRCISEVGYGAFVPSFGVAGVDSGWWKDVLGVDSVDEGKPLTAHAAVHRAPAGYFGDIRQQRTNDTMKQCGLEIGKLRGQDQWPYVLQSSIGSWSWVLAERAAVSFRSALNSDTLLWGPLADKFVRSRSTLRDTIARLGRSVATSGEEGRMEGRERDGRTVVVGDGGGGRCLRESDTCRDVMETVTVGIGDGYTIAPAVRLNDAYRFCPACAWGCSRVEGDSSLLYGGQCQRRIGSLGDVDDRFSAFMVAFGHPLFLLLPLQRTLKERSAGEGMDIVSIFSSVDSLLHGEHAAVRALTLDLIYGEYDAFAEVDHGDSAHGFMLRHACGMAWLMDLDKWAQDNRLMQVLHSVGGGASQTPWSVTGRLLRWTPWVLSLVPSLLSPSRILRELSKQGSFSAGDVADMRTITSFSYTGQVLQREWLLTVLQVLHEADVASCRGTRRPLGSSAMASPRSKRASSSSSDIEHHVARCNRYWGSEQYVLPRVSRSASGVAPCLCCCLMDAGRRCRTDTTLSTRSKHRLALGLLSICSLQGWSSHGFLHSIFPLFLEACTDICVDIAKEVAGECQRSGQKGNRARYIAALRRRMGGVASLCEEASNEFVWLCRSIAFVSGGIHVHACCSLFLSSLISTTYRFGRRGQATMVGGQCGGVTHASHRFLDPCIVSHVAIECIGLLQGVFVDESPMERLAAYLT